MNHPGVSRAIPGSIFGFLAGLAIVLGLRALQGLDPVWDPGVALVLSPFTAMFGWLWGIGAFNPKLSEHGEHHDDEHAIVPHEGDAHAAHHDDEEEGPFAIMMGQIWRVLTYSLVIMGIFYAIAALPTGLMLQTAADPAANPAAFGNEVTLNLFGNEFVTTQMVIFLGFVAFTILSLVIFGGGLGFLFFAGSNQVKIANRMQKASDSDDDNRPAIVKSVQRSVGRAAKGASKGIKEGLPKVLGQ